MKKSAIVVAALLLTSLLGACGGGAGKGGAAIAVYDFGVPTATIVGDGRWSRFALDVRSPPWFESLNIDYRLAYEDPLKQREYTQSRWAGAPATLLAQRLRQQLGMHAAGGTTIADCLLRVEVQEFSQFFDSPRESRALVQGNASVVDARRQLLSSRRFAIERKAASADAHGGVVALVAASDELAQQLASWLVELDASAALATCRPARAATP